MSKDFKELDKRFKKLVKEDKLDIGSLEDLMLKNLEDYKKAMKVHIEELLSKEVNEEELIAKKNKNGRTKDLISEIKEEKN